MPTSAPHRRHPVGTGLALGLVLVALVGSGCRVEPRGMANLRPDEPLAGLVVRGGLCADGTCRQEVQVDRAGHWTRTGGTAPRTEGTLQPTQLDALRAAVDDTELAGAAVNTRTCATASDGMELVVSWSPADEVHVVSSCERVVPVQDPLVVALEALLFGPAATAAG